MYNFCFLVLFFFCYSFIGYLIEIIGVYRIEKKIILSRGYFIGPYLPIFGFGALFIVGLLNKYQDDIIALFVMSMVICCLLEYFSSLILETIFKLRWWDYSDKKFNINGRICLEIGIGFGVGGVLIVKLFNPLLFSFLDKLPIFIIYISGLLLFAIMFIDFIVSTFFIYKLKNYSSIYGSKDSTVNLKKEVIASLIKWKTFYKRIIQAFPEFTKNYNINKIKVFIEDRKNKRRKD